MIGVVTNNIGLGSAGAAILAAEKKIGQARIIINTHKSIRKYSKRELEKWTV